MMIIDPVALGDVACTRATTKNVWDRAGTLVTVPTNTLAVTYDPSDLSKAPYALIEPSATNYATYSQDFTNAAWFKSALTVTPNAATAFGASNVGKLVPSTANTYHALSRLYAVTAGNGYTWTRFVQAAGYNYLYARFSGALQAQTGSSTAISSALAQSIHSGNVVAAYRYDVSKDSDPTWIGRCQLTSWYSETICPGTWRQQQASLAAAWAVSGAAAGDYYQSTADGKFYMLGGTAAAPTQTEVFRGNKRGFPAVAAILVEAGRVVIYDLTQPNAPMWMVFTCTTSGIGVYTGSVLISTSGLSSVFALNGKLLIGDGATTDGRLLAIDFISEKISTQQSSASFCGVYAGNISQRNAGKGYTLGTGTAIVNKVVNSVAATVLAGAPTDSATGLPVPTIVAATTAGVSVIKHDGTVVNSSNTGQTKTCAISGTILWLSNVFGATAYARYVDLSTITSSWGTTDLTGLPYPGVAGSADVTMTLPLADSTSLATAHYASGFSLRKVNFANIASSMLAYINKAYATGWLVGDNRGCFLADTVVETVTGVELVSNGTFTTDTSGWTAGNGATLSAVSGELCITSNGTSQPQATTTITCVVGKTYSLSSVGRKGTATSQVTVGVLGITQAQTASTTNVPLTLSFVATATTHTLFANIGGAAANGDTAYFDNISVRLATPDRSVKNRAMALYGSLTKSAVASSAQLVWYSGFSATNYAEQPHTGDLDFGTGPWAVEFEASTTLPAADQLWFEYCNPYPITAGWFNVRVLSSTGQLKMYVGDGTNNLQLTSTINVCDGKPHRYTVGFDGTNYRLLQDGADIATPLPRGTMGSHSNPNGTLRIGCFHDGTAPATNLSINLVRPTATWPSSAQMLQAASDELAMFQPGAQCTLDGTGSDAVTALAYDASTGWPHAGTAWGRTAFNGLVRAESAATQVGAVTAITAGAGAHVTAGASGARAVSAALSYPIPSAQDLGAVFDLVAGQVVASDPGITATITAMGNGYFRLRMSGTAGATGNGTVYTFVAQDASLAPSLTPFFAGDGTSGVNVWQEDFIDGLVPQSPIPTTSATVTRAADSIASGAGLVYSNAAIAEPAYSASTTYTAGDVVYDPASHTTYKSLIASNVGKPLTDASSWNPNGATNRWLMFDQYNNTQTSNAEEIIVCLSPQSVSRGVYLGNVDANEVRLSVVDLTEGLVYREVQNLVVSNSGSSFYNYAFKPIKRKSYAVSVALPPYANALVTIAIKKPGSTAKCGVCALGPLVDVGLSQYGISREIKDFSTVNFNFDGTSNVVKRNFAKILGIDVFIENDQIDSVIEALEGYRQKPVVWIGAAQYGSACLFGHYVNFKNVIQYPNESVMNLQIQGTV